MGDSTGVIYYDTRCSLLAAKCIRFGASFHLGNFSVMANSCQHHCFEMLKISRGGNIPELCRLQEEFVTISTRVSVLLELAIQIPEMLWHEPSTTSFPYLDFKVENFIS